MKYLQQTLGAQAVPIAAQLFDDTRITDPAHREPLARLALSYVGADAQANEFYQKAINDLTLTKGHRSNLIEDLNEDGLNFRNLTARDLLMIENRISLIEQLAPHAADAVNAAAFKEAYKGPAQHARARFTAGGALKRDCHALRQRADRFSCAPSRPF